MTKWVSVVPTKNDHHLKIKKNTMKRKYIKLDSIDEWSSGCHIKVGDSFEIGNKDGKSKQEHLEGIEYLKQFIGKEKLLPILVVKEYDKYLLLDGFKRFIAHKEKGLKEIEAFILDWNETVFYGEKIMRGDYGGQSYLNFISPFDKDYEKSKKQTNNS